MTHAYSIIVPEPTLARAQSHLDALRSGRAHPGGWLRKRVAEADLRQLDALGLLGKLFDTKQPQIFAESDVFGDGSDWTLSELGLLGDISVGVPVTVYDDGDHRNPTRHDFPFSGELVFTPGALLRNGRRKPPADWAEVVRDDAELFDDGYYALYERRLLPVFAYINARAANPRSAFVTIPGLGCGAFAGPFKGQLGRRLQDVLERFLSQHGAAFPNMAAVYFDPYDECTNSRSEIHGIAFMVRPLTLPGNERKSQLCHPADLQESGDDFSRCLLYSIVAWDHVSWPGNDFYIDQRSTDDGVKAAATNAMARLTGVGGAYVTKAGRYMHPHPYRNWEAVVREGLEAGRLRLWNDGAVRRGGTRSP